jgi:hypothetical protein
MGMKGGELMDRTNRFTKGCFESIAIAVGNWILTKRARLEFFE